MSGLIAVPAITDRTPFFTRGEPREALVVQTIARGEGFVLPRRNGDELPSKPPLFHWLGALAGFVHGRASEGAIRLPSLAAALVTVTATAAAAWAWWGAGTALITTVLLGSSFQWLSASVSARVDMLLAACIVLALLLFERAIETGRRIPATAFALLTAATLTKGPVGIALPVAIALLTLALRGELRFLGWREIRLLAVATGAALLWYLLAYVSGGDDFIAKQILKENVFRVLDADAVGAGHVEAFWYYLPLLAAGLAPWSLFLPGLAAFAIAELREPAAARSASPAADAEGSDGAGPLPLAPPAPAPPEEARRRLHANPRLLFVLVWALLTFVLFSFAGSKRGIYLLPAYPAYAMLLAVAFSRLLRDGAGPRARMLLFAGALLTAFLLAVLGIVLLAGSAGLAVDDALRGMMSDADANNVTPMLEAVREHRAVVLPCCLALLAAAWTTFHAARHARWARMLAAVAVAMLALSATVSTSLLPALASRRSPRSEMMQVQRVVPIDAPLYFYRAFDYGAVFYRGAPIPLREALADVPEIDGAWLLTWPAHLATLAEEARRLDTGGEAAGAYEVEEVLASGDHDPSDRTSLVLVRIKRRIGDERSGGN